MCTKAGGYLHIIYTPSHHSKLALMSVLCATQQSIFWKTIKVGQISHCLDPTDFHCMKDMSYRQSETVWFWVNYSFKIVTTWQVRSRYASSLLSWNWHFHCGPGVHVNKILMTWARQSIAKYTKEFVISTLHLLTKLQICFRRNIMILSDQFLTFYNYEKSRYHFILMVPITYFCWL